jgi:flagellar hook-associated protein 2
MAGLSGAISGISSNLDTTSIIDALLTYEKQNITLAQYNQTVKTNQITTYQAINTRLLAFQTQAGVLSRTDTYSATTINVSDEDYLTATAGTNVGVGTYSLNIAALAQNHQIASQGFSKEEAAKIGTGTITITVGDASSKTITIDTGSGTLEGIKNAINSAKAGVTASIINDGTTSNPYRLLLTSDTTGAKNKISISSSLSGAKIPDFSSTSFDQVEKLSFATAATSKPLLGTTASYTGSQNKTYTFTVGGNGTQTVGSGDITLNWTDGTNNGSIIVSSADTEVELSGTGSDGLKLSFAAGTLVAGDTFQVQSFAPLLQQAQDAKISMGSTSGGGSPITVTSDTNLVTDLIPGVTLNLKQVTTTSPITVNIDRDVTGIEKQVDDFISKFNDVLTSLDAQFTYDSANTSKTGALFGDSTLMLMQNSLRSQISSRIDGLDAKYSMLADIGIRFDNTGKLAVADRTKLEAAILDHPDDLQKLLTSSGNSSNSKISFVALTDKTKVSSSGYEVDITQAAEQGYLRGSSIANPAVTPLVIDTTNKNLKLKVDGVISDTITLTETTYSNSAALVNELQQKINADSKIGGLGVKVSYFDNGSDGYLILTSGSYGKSSKVEIQGGTTNSAFAKLGLALGQVFEGQNVAGTINGEKATGSGQTLTGNDGNSTTAGLKLKVELTNADLQTGSDGTIKISRGVAAQAQNFVNSLTKDSTGTIASRTKALQSQVDDIKSQVEELNQLMELKRQRLVTKFNEMETIIGQLNSVSSYLTSALGTLSSNWGTSTSSSSSSSSSSSGTSSNG